MRQASRLPTVNRRTLTVITKAELTGKMRIEPHFVRIRVVDSPRQDGSLMEFRKLLALMQQPMVVRSRHRHCRSRNTRTAGQTLSTPTTIIKSTGSCLKLSRNDVSQARTTRCLPTVHQTMNTLRNSPVPQVSAGKRLSELWSVNSLNYSRRFSKRQPHRRLPFQATSDVHGRVTCRQTRNAS